MSTTVTTSFQLLMYKMCFNFSYFIYTLLLRRVSKKIINYGIIKKGNIFVPRLKSLYIVRMEIATWLADLDETRQEVCEWIAKLKQFDKDKITSDAQLCHLSQSTFIKKRNR